LADIGADFANVTDMADVDDIGSRNNWPIPILRFYTVWLISCDIEPLAIGQCLPRLTMSTNVSGK